VGGGGGGEVVRGMEKDSFLLLLAPEPWNRGAAARKRKWGTWQRGRSSFGCQEGKKKGFFGGGRAHREILIIAGTPPPRDKEVRKQFGSRRCFFS